MQHAARHSTSSSAATCLQIVVGYLRVILQMIFIMHSATLLYHLPFLVRSEPRGPQQKLFMTTSLLCGDLKVLVEAITT
jgi:hypothetical protein